VNWTAENAVIRQLIGLASGLLRISGYCAGRLGANPVPACPGADEGPSGSPGAGAAGLPLRGISIRHAA
jgi:hypothetical protein